MRNKLFLGLAIAVPIIFTLLVWIQHPLYGYDWSIHHNIAKSLLFENKTISSLEWFVWYKYTPGVSILLAVISIFTKDALLTVKFASVMFSILFFTILLLVAREYNDGKKNKYHLVILYAVIFGLFELQVYTATIHSQLIGFILILSYIYFLFRKRYALATISVIAISITHLMTSYVTLIASIFLMFSIRKEKKLDMAIFFSNLWIIFYWTKYNLSTSTVLLRILPIEAKQTSWQLFFAASTIYILIFGITYFLRDIIRMEMLRKKITETSFKSIFIICSVMSIGIFMAGYAIYSERHEISLAAWIFTNSGRIVMIPVILSGIHAALKDNARKDKILLSFIIPLLLWVLIGPITYLSDNVFLSSIASQPLRALIYLSVPFAIISTKNNIDRTNINHIALLLLIALTATCLADPSIYNKTAKIPPYFFTKNEIQSMNYITDKIPEQSKILTSFRFNTLFSAYTKKYNVNELKEKDTDNAYMIITEDIKEYGILTWYGIDLIRDTKWIDNKSGSNDIIYNNGHTYIVKS